MRAALELRPRVARIGLNLGALGVQAMKVFDTRPKPLRLPSLSVFNFPEFGEKPAQDAIDFWFPVDEPESSPLADQKLCEIERMPGLARGLQTSTASPIDFPKSISDLYDTGIQISGPAIGIPGIASLHFVRGQKGVEFCALDANQKKLPLKGRVKAFPGSVELEIGKERTVEVRTRLREFGSFHTSPSGYGLEVNSTVRYLNQGVSDRLTTSFDGFGKPVEASYQRTLSDCRKVSVALKKGASSGEICLTQGGTGDGSKANQSVTVTRYKKDNQRTYHSAYSNYPF